MESEKRLGKRFGFLDSMEFLLREVAYAKMHKDNFILKRLELWKYSSENGKAKLD